jgi:hypothetical protein
VSGVFRSMFGAVPNSDDGDGSDVADDDGLAPRD